MNNSELYTPDFDVIDVETSDLFAQLDLDDISMSLGDIADNTDEIVDLLADLL